LQDRVQIAATQSAEGKSEGQSSDGQPCAGLLLQCFEFSVAAHVDCSSIAKALISVGATAGAPEAPIGCTPGDRAPARADSFRRSSSGYCASISEGHPNGGGVRREA